MLGLPASPYGAQPAQPRRDPCTETNSFAMDERTPVCVHADQLRPSQVWRDRLGLHGDTVVLYICFYRRRVSGEGVDHGAEWRKLFEDTACRVGQAPGIRYVQMDATTNRYPGSDMMQAMRRLFTDRGVKPPSYHCVLRVACLKSDRNARKLDCVNMSTDRRANQTAMTQVLSVGSE